MLETLNTNPVDTIPRMKVRDVKALIQFAEECRKACEARGEANWQFPAEQIMPAYPA